MLQMCLLLKCTWAYFRDFDRAISRRCSVVQYINKRFKLNWKMPYEVPAQRHARHQKMSQFGKIPTQVMAKDHVPNIRASLIDDVTD